MSVNWTLSRKTKKQQQKSAGFYRPRTSFFTESDDLEIAEHVASLVQNATDEEKATLTKTSRALSLSNWAKLIAIERLNESFALSRTQRRQASAPVAAEAAFSESVTAWLRR